MKVVLIGDSTVENNNGWGKAFAERFEPKRLCVYNCAVCGRSSKSWFDENRLSAALQVNPDYVLIQFGHNDQPGKGPERETCPDSSYREYLKIYIDASRESGAQPIIVSSLARRIFTRSGKIESSLIPWAKAAEDVAEAWQVPFIDLHAKSVHHLNTIGQEASMAYNLTKEDLTHLNPRGAKVFGDIIVEHLIEIEPSLKVLLLD